ncbi:carboxylesterase family protein [Streptomyces mirabilis]|nr:carboxylesterase family protein [Streptomyces mirabilis]
MGCADLSAACLQGKSSAEILAAQGGFDWGPVVGGAFLPVQPFEAYAKGAAARVPVLNGANEDEGGCSRSPGSTMPAPAHRRAVPGGREGGLGRRSGRARARALSTRRLRVADPRLRHRLR